MRNCLRMRSIVLTGTGAVRPGVRALAEPADGNGSSPTPTVELDTVTVSQRKSAQRAAGDSGRRDCLTMADIERAGCQQHPGRRAAHSNL